VFTLQESRLSSSERSKVFFTHVAGLGGLSVPCYRVSEHIREVRVRWQSGLPDRDLIIVAAISLYSLSGRGRGSGWGENNVARTKIKAPDRIPGFPTGSPWIVFGWRPPRC